MNEILDFQIVGNSVGSLLLAVGVIVFAFLVRRLVSEVVANFIIRLFTKKEKHNRSANFKKYISIPLGNLIFLMIAMTALDRLHAPSFYKIRIFKTSLEQVVDTVAQIVIIYSSFKLFIGISKFLFSFWRNKAEDTKDKSAMQLSGVVGGVVNVVLVIVAIIFIAKTAFGLDVSGFITSLGIFSAAIALAGKESLENLIASFIIFLDNPFYIGDYVNVGSNQGTIETIGLRSSRLRSPDQTIIVIPNKQMVDSVVTNFSLRTKWRYTENLEVSLATTTDQLKVLEAGIVDILSGHEKVDSQSIYLKETGKNAHIIYLEFYIVVGPTMQGVYDVYSDVNGQINDLFKKNNVLFAQESSATPMQTGAGQNIVKGVSNRNVAG